MPWPIQLGNVLLTHSHDLADGERTLALGLHVPTSTQVPELGSQSPGAMIKMANLVNGTTWEYVKITEDLSEIEFRKELYQGNNHKKYHQVRSGICVDDVQLSGKGSKVHVKKHGTAELDRVKRDMLTAHKKWTLDRANAASRATAEDAVAQFQDEPKATAPVDVPAQPAAADTCDSPWPSRPATIFHGLGTSYCPMIAMHYKQQTTGLKGVCLAICVYCCCQCWTDFS